MDRFAAINSVHYEFLYPLFRQNSAASTQEPHWTARTPLDRALEVARAHPDDAEGWRHLGERWLRKGNFLRAAAAFDRAHDANPADPSLLLRRAAALETLDSVQSRKDVTQALAEGAELPSSQGDRLVITEPSPDEEVATIYADVTDMIDYLGINVTFSGIQRVVANMFRQVRLNSRAHARDVVPVVPDYRNKTMYVADVTLLEELIDMVERGRPSRAHLDRLLLAIKSSLRPVEMRRGDCFLMAGAFWILHSYDLLKEMREQGVAIVVFIHDLIQIDNPEYVHAAATEAFRRSLVDVAEVSSFLLTNSRFVAGEVRRFLAEDMQIEKPVHPVPLATEMSLIPADPWADESLAAEFGENGYALCVCTLEIRKNHRLLFRIWEELLSQGYRTLPKLVLVGKWGWEIDDFRELLERNGYLGGYIKVMPAVSDEALASLYRNCRFTLYPSFAEGWGLPIGESLVFGKPCIASGVTSMPEVGGALVRYIDPTGFEDGLAAVRRVLDDPADLARWTEQVRREFVPTSWADFTNDLLGATRALALTVGVPAAFARLLPGDMAIVGNDALKASAEAGRTMRTARMVRERGWEPLEDSGVWTNRRVASLRFLAETCPPGAVVRVVAMLRGEAGHGQAVCRLHSNLETTPPQLLASHPTAVSCTAEVDADGAVELQIIATGDAIRIDTKEVFVNLSRLGYCVAGDGNSQLDLMEAIHLEG